MARLIEWIEGPLYQGSVRKKPFVFEYRGKRIVSKDTLIECDRIVVIEEGKTKCFLRNKCKVVEE